MFLSRDLFLFYGVSPPDRFAFDWKTMPQVTACLYFRTHLIANLGEIWVSRRIRTLARSSSSQSAARVGTRDASDRVVGRAALERGFLAGSWPDYLEVSFIFTTFCKVSTAFLQFYTV
jgi:hypothetical protein